MFGLKLSHEVAMTFVVTSLLPGCVSQQKYDALQSRYDHLSQRMSSEISAKQMHIERLQNAIKVTQGFGDANPVASNDTAEGRAQNRRVELTLTGSGN